VKRSQLIRELVAQGCYLRRRGKRHDIYANPITGRKAPIPRHSEIKETLCKLISVQKPRFGISRGAGCSRSGVFWTRSQEGEGAKIRSERSHDGVASVAEGICRFPALKS